MTLDLAVGTFDFRSTNAASDVEDVFGDDGNIDRNGAPIAITTAGSHTVELDLRGPLYRYTITRD